MRSSVGDATTGSTVKRAGAVNLIRGQFEPRVSVRKPINVGLMAELAAERFGRVPIYLDQPFAWDPEQRHELDYVQYATLVGQMSAALKAAGVKRPRRRGRRVRGVNMEEIELSVGTIEYEDTGGDGPVIVLLHGLLMDPSLWDAVTADLRVNHSCVAPTLPLGGHRHPMGADADLSMRGITRLVAELLERLDVDNVTVVGNDTGGALVQLLVCEGVAHLDRIVLVSCDAFDNFPPGLTGKTLVLTGKLPPTMFGLFMQQMRLKPLRRLPIAFGWLTKRGDDATARWVKPVLQQPEIRRDTVRVLRTISAQRKLMLEAAECLPTFGGPALVVWAEGDRVMPPEHGRRLAELLPHGRLVEVPDSQTLVPLDQPARLAQAIREFVHENGMAAQRGDPSSAPPSLTILTAPARPETTA